MNAPEFTMFDTPIGLCGAVWGKSGLLGVQLPEADTRKTEQRLLRRFPEASEAVPPAAIRDAIRRMVELLSGAASDFLEVALDMDGVPEFARRVYGIARTIPRGCTLTYGDVAARLGDRSLARDVGQALARNPFPIVVPCHRVVAANGKPGGFSATGGTRTKLRLLAIEGVTASEQADLFDGP